MSFSLMSAPSNLTIMDVCVFGKKKQLRKLKPHAKHPAKVNIWRGISTHGATQLVIFTGIMTAVRYCNILETALLPFLKDVFPDSHRYQQGNGPKHCTKYTKRILERTM